MAISAHVMTNFEIHSERETFNQLIALSNHWCLRWKRHFYRSKVKEPHGVDLKSFERKTELLFPRTGLPNYHFLSLLLETCCHEACQSCFPFSVTRLSVHHYSELATRYSRKEIDTSIDLVVSSIHCQVEGHRDVLIQDSEGSFYLVSFQSSISRITKLVDDIHKRLSGLTIPYPGGPESIPVRVDAGIALFKSREGVDNWHTCVELAELSCLWAEESGKSEISVYA